MVLLTTAAARLGVPAQGAPRAAAGDDGGGHCSRPNFRTTFEKIEPEQGDSDLAVV